MCKKPFLFIFLFLAVLQCRAQEIEQPPAKELTLEEVVVSAFNASRRLLSMPGSLTLIPSAQIEAENPLTVLPLLQQASGVYAHSGTLSTSRITIRGIGAREPYSTGKIRAYFNNIPLTNGSGVSIVEHIDPSVIERLEIIKGPATSVYGAGLGGTINIVARQPALRPGGVTNATQLGSFGLFRNSLLLDGSRKDLSGSLVYSNTSMDGYRQNSEYRRNALTGIGQFSLSQKTRGTALVYFSDMKGSIPSSIDSLTFIQNPRAAAANWLNVKGYEDTRKLLAGLSVQHQFNAAWALDLSLFATLHNEMERRPWDFLFEDRESAGTRIRASWFRQSGLYQWKLTGGGELFFEDFRYKTHEHDTGAGLQGDAISRNREGIRFFNVFVQTDLDYNRLTLSGGVNLNSNRVKYRDLLQSEGIDHSAIYNYGFILSPRLSANYRYKNLHAVFATLSHGFSPPSIAETLTPDGFVNLDILPEKSWNVETGLRGSILQNSLFYDLVFFRMLVRDLLVAERVGPDAWVGKNAGSSVHQGIEAEISGKLFKVRVPSPHWYAPDEAGWRLAYSLNHFLFKEFVDQGVDYSGKQIPGVPGQFLFTGISLRLAGGIYARADLSLSGRMPMNDLNTRYSDAYHLLDLTLGYRQAFGKWKLDFFGSINNLTRQQYASMVLVNAPSFGNALPRYYYPGLPINYALGMRLAYLRN